MCYITCNVRNRLIEMPLPPPDPDREPLHARRIDVQGWRRRDGLFEVEATLTDTKATPSAWTRADGVLHLMSIRIRFDEAMVVHDVTASSDVTPHPVCPRAVDGLASLRGLAMGAGWSRAVRERLAGAAGCTHLVELLGPLASTAFQTTTEHRVAAPDRVDADGRPVKIDSCIAYARGGELVRRRWPRFAAPADPTGSDA